MAVEHGEQAQRKYGRAYCVLPPSGGEKCGFSWQAIQGPPDTKILKYSQIPSNTLIEKINML
jgi:hypothetical protein